MASWASSSCCFQQQFVFASTTLSVVFRMVRISTLFKRIMAAVIYYCSNETLKTYCRFLLTVELLRLYGFRDFVRRCQRVVCLRSFGFQSVLCFHWTCSVFGVKIKIFVTEILIWNSSSTVLTFNSVFSCAFISKIRVCSF